MKNLSNEELIVISGGSLCSPQERAMYGGASDNIAKCFSYIGGFVVGFFGALL